MTSVTHPPTKRSTERWALEIALREIQAIREGKIDPLFLDYTERVIKKALAAPVAA